MASRVAMGISWNTTPCWYTVPCRVSIGVTLEDALRAYWTQAGTQIAFSAKERVGMVYLEREMYREKAPDNGHRLNILDHSFRNVGIDVYFDKTHNKMWFTQDFGQPA